MNFVEFFFCGREDCLISSPVRTSRELLHPRKSSRVGHAFMRGLVIGVYVVWEEKRSLCIRSILGDWGVAWNDHSALHVSIFPHGSMVTAKAKPSSRHPQANGVYTPGVRCEQQLVQRARAWSTFLGSGNTITHRSWQASHRSDQIGGPPMPT